MNLAGIIPPVVTPFLADESLDLVTLCTHIDLMLAKGVDGIFVLGTTGEFYALDESEKQQVVAAAGDVAGPGVAHLGVAGEAPSALARPPVGVTGGADVLDLTRGGEAEGDEVRGGDRQESVAVHG